MEQIRGWIRIGPREKSLPPDIGGLSGRKRPFFPGFCFVFFFGALDFVSVAFSSASFLGRCAFLCHLGHIFTQIEIECGAFAGLGLSPNASTMTANDALHDGKTDSGALEFRVAVQPLKGGKELVFIFRVKTCAIVANEKGLAPVHRELVYFNDVLFRWRLYLTAFESRFTNTCRTNPDRSTRETAVRYAIRSGGRQFRA